MPDVIIRSDIDAFLKSATNTEALGHIGLNFSPVTVADAAARKNPASYPDGVAVGVTRAIQSDLPGILWNLVAAGVTLDASWIGQPYTVDPDGDIIVSMELADLSGTVPDAGVLGRVGLKPTIGDSITTGGKRIALADSLLHLTLCDPAGDNAIKGYDLPVIPEEAFGFSITVLSLGNNVTEIASSAFIDCELLTSLIIPDNVATLGSSAFNGCIGVVFLKIGEGLTTIPGTAFKRFTSLTTLEFPTTPLEIAGAEAFSLCLSLVDLIIPSNVTITGSNAFSEGGLESVTIESGVTNLGEYTFASNPSLATVNSKVSKAVWDASTDTLVSTASPLTIHVLPTDTSWTVGTGLTIAGNTNVTVIADLAP